MLSFQNKKVFSMFLLFATVYAKPVKQVVNAQNLQTYNSSCLVCEGLVTGVKIDSMTGVVNDTQVASMIKSLCSYFPENTTTACSVVSDNIPHIVGGLKSGLNVSSICQDLTLCPVTHDQSVSLSKPLRQTHYGDPYNTLCLPDEFNVTLNQGLKDETAICAPLCEGRDQLCVQDVPNGMTARPSCSLQTVSGLHICAPICDPNSIKQQCSSDEHIDCVPMGSSGVCL